jgi:hypothetical protein
MVFIRNKENKANPSLIRPDSMIVHSKVTRMNYLILQKCPIYYANCIFYIFFPAYSSQRFLIYTRGYWDTPEEASKAAIIDQFKDQIQQAGLLGLRETLYFPRYTGKLFLFIFLPIRIFHHLQSMWEFLAEMSFLFTRSTVELKQNLTEAKKKRMCCLWIFCIIFLSHIHVTCSYVMQTCQTCQIYFLSCMKTRSLKFFSLMPNLGTSHLFYVEVNWSLPKLPVKCWELRISDLLDSLKWQYALPCKLFKEKKKTHKS